MAFDRLSSIEWGRGARRARSLVLPCLLAVLLALTSCSSSDKPDDSAPSLASLKVSQNLIVGDNGKRVVLTGAADYLLPFYTDDGKADAPLAVSVEVNLGRRDADFAEMRKAGYNTVRVPLGVDAYANNVYSSGGKSDYLHKIQQVVTSAKNAGLYVVFGWWDVLSGPQTAASIQPSLDMMRDVGELFRDDSNVLFEPVNEPSQIEWSDWRTNMSTIVTWWRKTIGYKRPLIIDTINYSWDFDPDQAKQLQAVDAGLLGGTSQIVFANHRYANASQCFCDEELNEWQSTVGQYVGSFPLLGTEYGFYNHQGPPQPTWNSQLFTYLGQKAVPAGFNGALAFVWHWVDENSMTSESSQPNANAASYNQNFVANADGVR